MEIIFGRDETTGKLKINFNGKDMLYGEPDSVDMSVSRRHCKLEIDESGRKTLVNLKPTNRTMVNKQAVERKDNLVVSDDIVIELGFNGYVLELKDILKRIGVKEVYSISHLEQIIEGYKEAKLNLQINERKLNAKRGFVPIFGSLAIIVGVFPDLGVWRIILLLISMSLTAYFAYVGFVTADNMPRKMAELDKEYQEKCTCPGCGIFLPGRYVDILTRGGCPQCQCKFKE